jgi:hypothetical protein
MDHFPILSPAIQELASSYGEVQELRDMGTFTKRMGLCAV